ncbi:MAG: hypothetical protein M1510_13225 [Nitrospirae bacterium]|nr:hypothetical protein [Nitrospirota bacterium]MCL5237929.1 hypothetical protein [Nitrospirota bacterium]
MRRLARSLAIWLIALVIAVTPMLLQKVFAADASNGSAGSNDMQNSTTRGEASGSVDSGAAGTVDSTRGNNLTGESPGSSGSTYSTPWQKEPSNATTPEAARGGDSSSTGGTTDMGASGDGSTGSSSNY